MARKRINALASLVIKDSVVADIGTDHAFLLIKLLEDKKIKYAYAIDNKDGPITNAINNINKHNFNKVCEVIKADGLNFNLNKNVDTLVFAGLGGITTIEIINKDINKLKFIKYIVTDIHRDDDKVNDFLKELHFNLDEEITIIDKKQKYHLCRYRHEN